MCIIHSRILGISLQELHMSWLRALFHQYCVYFHIFCPRTKNIKYNNYAKDNDSPYPKLTLAIYVHIHKNVHVYLVYIH